MDESKRVGFGEFLMAHVTLMVLPLQMCEMQW